MAENDATRLLNSLMFPNVIDCMLTRIINEIPVSIIAKTSTSSAHRSVKGLY